MQSGLIVLVPDAKDLLLFLRRVFHDIKHNLDQVALDSCVIGSEVVGQDVLEVVRV